MNKPTSYIVAALACIGIFIVYVLVVEALGLKRGGGYFFLIITIGATTATWRAITGASN